MLKFLHIIFALDGRQSKFCREMCAMGWAWSLPRERRRPRVVGMRSVWFLAWAALSWAGADSVEPPALEFKPGIVGWTRLELRASAWGIKAHTEMELSLGAAGGPAEPASQSSENPAASASGDGPSALLTIESRFLGVATHERILFDPETGVATTSERRYSGRKTYAKEYTFDQEGLIIRRSAPAEGEDPERPESWSLVSEAKVPLPAPVNRGNNQANALLYLLAASPLDEAGDQIRIPIFSGGGWLWVKARVSGLARIKARYQETKGDEVSHRDGYFQTLVIQVGGEVMDPAAGEDRLEMMGLEGELRVYLEPENRIPLRISGRARMVGNVDIKLKKVSLSTP